jgi:hypothetical protein
MHCSFIAWQQHWLFTIHVFKELKKNNLFLVTIAAIFHNLPGLETISIENYFQKSIHRPSVNKK